MSFDQDAIVIGAGPAGVSAGIHLARKGLRVTIIDKATFPRDKCCGDGLTTSALRRLENLGLEPKSLDSWRVIRETLWRSPSGRVIHLNLPPDDGIRIAVARRSELDATLIELARQSDVTVLEGAPLIGFEQIENGVCITAGSKTLEAPYVIGADGMWSSLRKMATPEPEPESEPESAPTEQSETQQPETQDSLTESSQADPAEHSRPEKKTYLGDIHAFRQYFTHVEGPARDRLWVSFEPDLIPGYLWSFPVGEDGVNIGFGVARRAGESTGWMKDVWPDLLNRPHVKAMLGEHAVAEGPHKAWPIPAKIEIGLLTAAGGRVMFIGDAARVIDPLTGEGIGQALETGEMVAKVIARYGPDDPARAAKSYRNAIRFGMAIDNGFASVIAKLVSNERGARAAIWLAPRGPFRGQYALRWAFEDNPRAALLTPWRWPSRFKSKSGAFWFHKELA